MNNYSKIKRKNREKNNIKIASAFNLSDLSLFRFLSPSFERVVARRINVFIFVGVDLYRLRRPNI